MNISSNMTQGSQIQSSNGIKSLFSEKLTKDEVTELRAQIQENMNAFAFDSTSMQTSIASSNNSFEQDYTDFQSFLTDIGYNGKPIAELSQSEASELVSEDGIFGIKQTSERIANFVIQGANGDEDMLRAGREGMLQGFSDATKMLGGKLPDISQKTIQAATEMVDKAMYELGFSILDQEI